MQKEEHRFHGAEYVEEDHTDKEQERYAAEQAAPIEMYFSLEEIANDVSKIQHDGMAYLVWEKLQKTIKSGGYLQKDGTK